MTPCISQVTTLKNPIESDATSYRSGGWGAVELWLTKLEAFVDGAHSAAEASSLFEAAGVRPVAAAGQGGLLLSRGPAREAHWGHFRRRLELLRELGVSTLIVAADSAANVGRAAELEDFPRAAAALGEAAELAGEFGVRVALEFQKASPICASLETAVALAAQCGSRNAGVCLDVFHFQTGPSKLEDLDGLPGELIAWVQLSDVSNTPRELAGDSDRILPGDGDFPLAAIVERLARTGYDGFVSLELLNPHLWQIPADRVTELGRRALVRVLGPHREDAATPSARRRARRRLGGRSRRRALSVSSVATLQPATAVFREEQFFDCRVYALIASVGLSSWQVCCTGTPGPPSSWQAGAGRGHGPVRVVRPLPAAHDHRGHPERRVRVWFGWVPVYRRVVPLTEVRSGRARDVPADRRLRFLGHPLGSGRRARVDRARQPRGPDRADRRVAAGHRQPAPRGAGPDPRERTLLAAYLIHDPDDADRSGRTRSDRIGGGSRLLVRP